MAGERYDLTRQNNIGVNHPIEIGVDFTLSLAVEDGGTPRPMSAARFTVKTAWDGGTVILEFTESDSEVTITEGNILVEIGDDVTSGYDPRSADLEDEFGAAFRTAVYELVATTTVDSKQHVLLYGEEVEFLPRDG